MVKPLTTEEANAIFPMNEKVMGKLHPDGKPWNKCCGTKDSGMCACRTFELDNHRSRLDTILAGLMPNGWKKNLGYTDADIPRIIHPLRTQISNLLKSRGRFFCVHRTTEDGYYRECAGWAAKYNRR